MPKRVVHLADPDISIDGRTLRDRVLGIQQELRVSAEFPPGVEACARDAVALPRLPTTDRTELPFVTIDPASAMDLDQALYLERSSSGYLVHYAIADVAAFVAPDDPVDIEANRRGETLYGADSKIPLHPKSLSESAASLLPDQIRPALVWTLKLDTDGDCTDVHVERALVRSRAKLDYRSVQRSFDDGTIDPMLALLKEVGELRLAKEQERGGVSLPLPSQEIQVANDQWSLSYEQPLAVEQWNAQISLLTGMGAASLMLDAQVGILRTLPPAEQTDLDRLRHVARAVGQQWPGQMPYPEFIRSVDPASPSGAAVLVAATRTLRGAGYVSFNGSVPPQPRHSALAASYTHVTAPLRRLIDRFTGEICLALCAGKPVPDWVLARLDQLPETMRESTRRANQYERAILDLVEAALLADQVGSTFEGILVSVDEKAAENGSLMIASPSIEGPIHGTAPLPLGQQVSARLRKSDVDNRQILFDLLGTAN